MTFPPCHHVASCKNLELCLTSKFDSARCDCIIVAYNLNGLFPSTLVSDVLKRCIQRALEGSADSVAAFMSRLLLSLLSHAAMDQDHDRAMQDVQDGCSRKGRLFTSGYNIYVSSAMKILSQLNMN